jgi:FdhD protein
VPRGRAVRILTRTWDGTRLHRAPDELAVEEPMQIQLDGVLVATTMRTPGHDFELAVGFCFTEGLLAGAPVLSCRYCADGSAVETAFNIVTVETGGQAPAPAPRLTAMTSACGICGSEVIGELRERLRPLPAPTEPFEIDALAELPERVLVGLNLFEVTGAVHAAVLVDGDGEIVVKREDVGRHNAVDKVVGRLLLDGQLPASGCALVVSGRVGFEIVQKAWAAGIPAIVAVGAPTLLAVTAARQARMTLVGWARDGNARVYSPE